jgi:hypothetical protein
MLTFFVSLFGMWATLVWSARLLLQDSLLYMSLIGMFGVLLLYVLIIISSHFKSVVQELDSAFWFFETLMFATAPLLCSTILAWFLCVEIPAFDISLTFAACYFAYVIWICDPKPTSEPINLRPGITLKSVQHKTYVLNLTIMQTVWVMPVVLCPMLYAATAHNVLFSSATHVLEFAVSALWPLVLMLFCAQRQLAYWPSEDERNVSGVIGRL